MKRFFIYAGCLLALVASFIAFEGPVRANDLSVGNNNTYEYTVVSADSEEEAITSLREQGYEPVMENIARDSSGLIIGVLIGMFSMKIGRAAKDKGGSR